ncbi:MAG TPA: ribonuclease J [Candidatus Saccharimonadales bacterium]|nr:ribonuclease J [Candidatus Saccharimonadales bacterium]
MNQHTKTPSGPHRARFAAARSQQRTLDRANRQVNHHAVTAPKRQSPLLPGSLKITFLGGQDAVGEKNMQVIEWQNDALILDCGNDLSVDLPGINYAVNDVTYLESIKHKIRGYVISHGHLDHLGGLRHTVPQYPAPIFGTPFTLGVVEKSFADAAADTGLDFAPQLMPMNMDTHERLPLGAFTIELVRVTHSVPESSCIVVDTPVGRIINSGDFRLDPEPLDHMPTDIARLRHLGDEGVLALLSESTYADIPGRQLTEHTLQQSFHDVIGAANGRVFISIFSSNMNRIQMIINAAAAAGRRVALEGRSMMNYAEIAVRQGILKIPKDTVLPLREMPNIPDTQVLVICTGGQGEPGSALQRMSDGEHKLITLRSGDTVVISSNPIPGNGVRYQILGNDLAAKGVTLYRNPSHQVDGCGPLHVGGHARREEHRELLQLLRPKFFVPIYGGALNRKYHGEIAMQEGWKPAQIIQAANGESISLSAERWQRVGHVPHGSVLVDQNGGTVAGIVVKDRLLLSQEGIVTVVLTIDKRSGQLLTSPDIISRGFITVRDNEALMSALRSELRSLVAKQFKRQASDQFKQEVKETVAAFLFAHTARSSMVIPVVNVVGGRPRTQAVPSATIRQWKPSRPAVST